MAASKWAILIGIDPLPSADSDLDSDDSETDDDDDTLNVSGDVERMRCFLQQTMGFPAESIYSLVSSAGDSSALPTYANILKAFELVTKAANAGDVVYIHFSGSSVQNTTTRGLDQGRRAQEEYFTVLDSENKGRLLHELELAVLVNRLTQKGLDVTVVLDTRSTTSYSENKHRFRESEFSEEELLSVFHGFWCPERWDTVLHNPNSGAPFVLLWSKYWNGYSKNPSEYQDPQSKSYHGFLTYWIPRLLEKHGLQMTWNEIVRQIGLETHQSQVEKPGIIRIRVESYGNTERLFLEGFDERRELTPALIFKAQLTKVDSEFSLILDAGSAHGMTRGTRVQFVPVDHEQQSSDSLPAELLFVVDEIRPLSSSAKLETPLEVDATIAKTQVNGSATVIDTKLPVEPRFLDSQVDIYRTRLGLSGNCEELLDQIKVYPVGGYRYKNGSTAPNIRSPTVGADRCLHLLNGDYATVFLSSTCKEIMYLNILSFDSAFGITQMSPKTYHESPNTLDYRTLVCHLSFDIRILLPQAKLRDSQTSSVAYFKVFVTNKPTSFHSLELSAIRDENLVSKFRDKIPTVPGLPVGPNDTGFLEAYSQRPPVRYESIVNPVEEKWCCFDLKFIVHSTPESLAAV
ncbi:hypothetical protein AbraIFM66950_006373 [Aspergillus brasiliensis]|nr:hypothetical protein AbraIFM66950_006373 [Aspergillus brasiliensis]